MEIILLIFLFVLLFYSKFLMGSFLKCILDQAFPPSDVFFAFCCKSALVSELPFQVAALVFRAGHLFPGNPGCFQCVCDFTCAAVACVRADWMLALEATVGVGTWLQGSSQWCLYT